VRNLAVLGSTGSVGTQTLDVVRSFPGEFNVVGLAARRSIELLAAQVKEFETKLVSCEATSDERAMLLSNGCTECGMEEMVRHPEVDTVVAATVGDVGLEATFAAIDAGKRIALANKESVVMAGEAVMRLAAQNEAELIPVDSEPSAIWQCLRGEKNVSKLIITASGGAFRDIPAEKMADVTPDQALRHPTWSMGPKITIDSATMMNKAFEVIEAHWLFGIPWDDIEIVLHPQSFIHSMVEFVDGSVKAQVSTPDMRLPIQYALFFPDRMPNKLIPRFDPVSIAELSFKPWEPERYPCFNMALDIAKRGGPWPAALCGADDAAVKAFLERRIGFLEIETVIREALKSHEPNLDPSIDDVIVAAASARSCVADIVGG
jgi:1-deoxy-D-xylulose-5-phosphate reductoisomerase